MGTSNTRYDVNGDGTVNFLDLATRLSITVNPGAAGAPTIVGMKMSAAQIDIIEEQIDLLIATNDRSPAAMRVLVYLQQLLVTARPEKDAVACELSESVQSRDVDSLRVGDGYACATSRYTTRRVL